MRFPQVVFLGPGCVFGEDSLLEEQAHYTITTTKRSELFYISKKVSLALLSLASLLD